MIDDPIKPTLDELANQALLSLENRERYLAQSAATTIGELAALPPRPPLIPFAGEASNEHRSLGVHRQVAGSRRA
jgi:hypothetical protein